MTADGRPKSSIEVPLTLADGSDFLPGNERRKILYSEGYINKLRYINGAILQEIDRIKKTFSAPLIIVLHGDHGGGLYFDQNDKFKTCLHERFSPLLAVYATNPAILSAFTNNFNLVNIYRAIFRVLLNVKLPNLPDRSTFINWNLDKSFPIEPGELDMSCAQVNNN